MFTMDLYNLWLLLLLLAEMGVCSGAQLVMPEAVSGVRGKSVNFTASGPPSAEVQTVTWSFIPKPGTTVPIYTATKENEKVSSAYSGRVKYYRSTYTLQLNSLRAEDSGTYTLTIVDSNLDQLVDQTVLVVLEPLADVNIFSNLPEAVEFNSTVVLTCSAKGSDLSYSWLNNSAPVVVDGKHVVQNGRELAISQVFRTDLQGPIYCIAKNQVESATSSAFTLTVNYGPDLITIKREPADDVLNKGSNLTLSCSAQSSPAAEIIWLFNEVKLPQNTATLVLSNFGRNQSGNYSCIAYNSKTKRYVTSEVITLTLAGERESDGQLSEGAIAGIVIAVLLLVAIIMVIIYKRQQIQD
ncbi:hypothetical protein PGIGA_G00197240 [Pangasianodon gigas]|uniref:Uncharacterized protein n=1 Tax=Pangasianodon gigas TaxID=30993 RepID=A0ACC5XZ72_PANGG|nr:hypothetical protein [Pangasianodon gigas]